MNDEKQSIYYNILKRFIQITASFVFKLHDTAWVWEVQWKPLVTYPFYWVSSVWPLFYSRQHQHLENVSPEDFERAAGLWKIVHQTGEIQISSLTPKFAFPSTGKIQNKKMPKSMISMSHDLIYQLNHNFFLNWLLY